MSDNSKGICYGFISVRIHPEFGYYGGLLVVNTLARPLEFHCTLPVKPSRAQSILYGPTLNDFVCGEQIARALLSKSKSTPIAIFSDSSPVLSVRHFVSIPIAWIDIATSNAVGSSFTVPQSPEEKIFRSLQIEDVQIKVPDVFIEDGQAIVESWKEHSPQIDLHEPFGRITEALLEANPAAKAA